MFAAAQGSQMYMTVVLIVVMVVMMYFTMVRGPKKQQEKRKEMMNGLHKGDTVLTLGGLYGVVDSVNVKKGTVVLDANGVFLTFSLQAIGRVTKRAAEAKTAEPAAEKAEEKKED